MVFKNSKNGSFFDSNNYIISLNYKQDNFYKAYYNFKKNGEVSPILRSFLHEHAHFLQFATTTVGYYLKLLGDYQLNRITACFRVVMNSKEKVYPLFKNVMNIKNRHVKNDKVAYHYYYWVLCELIRLLILGDTSTLDYYQQYMMEGLGLFDYFFEQDQEFKKLYNIKSDSYENIEYSDQSLDQLNYGIFTTIFTNLSMTSVIESEALLTEYHFDDVADERLLKLLGTKSTTVRTADYLFPLVVYRDIHNFDLTNKRDFLRFKLGFHGICQIVLNSPMLPFQRHNSTLRLTEIELNTKFVLLLLSHEINPPEKESEYNQYLNELLAFFNWISLNENYNDIEKNQSILMNNPLSLSTFKESIFISAQKMYNKDAFNYYCYLSSYYSDPDMFCLKFIDNELDYPIEKFSYLTQNLASQFYKELLYGYNFKQSPEKIYVHTPVRMSKPTLNILEMYADFYNSTWSNLRSDFPKMIIRNNNT